MSMSVIYELQITNAPVHVAPRKIISKMLTIWVIAIYLPQPLSDLTEMNELKSEPRLLKFVKIPAKKF